MHIFQTSFTMAYRNIKMSRNKLNRQSPIGNLSESESNKDHLNCSHKGTICLEHHRAQNKNEMTIKLYVHIHPIVFQLIRLVGNKKHRLHWMMQYQWSSHGKSLYRYQLAYFAQSMPLQTAVLCWAGTNSPFSAYILEVHYFNIKCFYSKNISTKDTLRQGQTQCLLWSLLWNKERPSRCTLLV